MIQDKFEELIESERFGMPALYSAVWPMIEAHEASNVQVAKLKAAMGANYVKLGFAILRHVFLAEVVKVPTIETTKMRLRWFEQLIDDPRFCSFDECFAIALKLFDDLVTAWIEVPERLQILNLFFREGILPYEAPIDYLDRPMDGSRIHRIENIGWTCTDTMLRTMKLRSFLRRAETSPAPAFFVSVLEDKVKVKTYLTDRVLTGEYKTNREKRWEVHPLSVHFAFRRSCMDIEYALIGQLCRFEGFPTEYLESLQNQGILPADHETFCCPITLEPMSFVEFKHQLENPTHGKSSFQVGHLNPLKLDDPTDLASGHTAENISWVSADGNRIQGSMSLTDVRALLQRITSNYETRGWD
jgi:hypothetical protein